MKTTRAILIGACIWIIGVGLYSISFYVPLMNDMEKQANIVLSITVIPLVWLGSLIHYRKGAQSHGLKTGLIFFAIAALLDALITVPVLVIPNGGSYYEFFTDMGFWLIGIEFVGVTALYRYFKVKRTREFI